MVIGDAWEAFPAIELWMMWCEVIFISPEHTSAALSALETEPIGSQNCPRDPFFFASARASRFKVDRMVQKR